MLTTNFDVHNVVSLPNLINPLRPNDAHVRQRKRNKLSLEQIIALSPVRRQTIIWTKADLFLNRP